MAIKKPAIPTISTADIHLASVLTAMKENIETITGARGTIGTIDQLADTADLATVIRKINEIVARLNFKGE